MESKEEEFKKKYEAEADERVENVVSRLNAERAKEKKDLLRQQRAEIEMLKKQTLQEMEVK